MFKLFEWFNDNFGLSICLAGLLIVGLFIWGVKSSINEKTTFMEECMEDLKQYECTALWRQGNKGTTAVPVVIPMR